MLKLNKVGLKLTVCGSLITAISLGTAPRAEASAGAVAWTAVKVAAIAGPAAKMTYDWIFDDNVLGPYERYQTIGWSSEHKKFLTTLKGTERTTFSNIEDLNAREIYILKHNAQLADKANRINNNEDRKLLEKLENGNKSERVMAVQRLKEKHPKLDVEDLKNPTFTRQLITASADKDINPTASNEDLTLGTDENQRSEHTEELSTRALSFNDAKQYIRGLTVKMNTKGTDKYLYIDGIIPVACKDSIKIEFSKYDEENKVYPISVSFVETKPNRCTKEEIAKCNLKTLNPKVCMNINDSRSNALSGNDVVFTKDHTDSGHLKNCKNEAQLCPGQEVKGINLSRTGNVAFRTESLMLDSMGEDSNSDVFIHRNGKASVASKTAEDAMIFKDSKTLAQEQRAQERKDAAAEEVEKKNKQVETCEAAKKGDLEALATLKSEGFDPKIIAKIEEANKKQELVDREKDMRALEDKVGKATKLSQMKELIAEIEEFANNNDALKERSVELLNELADKAMEFEIEKDSDFRKSTGVALEAYAAIKRLEPSYEGLKKKIADVKAGRLIDRARNAGYSNDLDELSRVQAEAHKEYRNALRAGMRSRRSDSASNEAANVFRQVIQQREIEVRKPSAKEPNGYKIMGNNLDRAYADSLTRAEGKTVSEMQHDYSYGSLTNTPYTNQNRQDSRFP